MPLVRQGAGDGERLHLPPRAAGRGAVRTVRLHVRGLHERDGALVQVPAAAGPWSGYVAASIGARSKMYAVIAVTERALMEAVTQ